MIAAAFVQVRKVRASQGRMPDGESYGKGGKAV